MRKVKLSLFVVLFICCIWFEVANVSASKAVVDPIWAAKEELLSQGLLSVGPPVVNDNSYGMLEDGVLTVGGTGVLGNDSDPESDPMTAVLGTPPSSGELDFRPDGTFVYTPSLHVNGIITFTYYVHDTPNDLLGYWPMDDGMGDIARDWSSYGHHGSMVNTPVWTTTKPSPIGFANSGALNFPLGDHHLDFGIQPAHQPIENFTISAWVNVESFQEFASVFGNVYDSFSNESGYSLGTRAPDRLYFTVVSTSTATLIYWNVAFGLSTDQWYHVVATYDEATGREVYLDGVSIYNSNSTLGPMDYTPQHSLKAGILLDDDESREYNGMIDDLRFYGRVLTPAEIALLASGDRLMNVSNEGTVTINITPQNDPPVPVPDFYTMDEDGVLDVPAPGVLGNDIEYDGESLTAVFLAPPSDGVVDFNSDGSFTYTPTLNFNGTDSFTYRAWDGTFIRTSTVTIDVLSINDTPDTMNDAFPFFEDTIYSASGLGVVNNDNDVDGDQITVVLVDDTLTGELRLEPNGDFVFTTTQDYFGLDGFSYVAHDARADLLGYWPFDEPSGGDQVRDWSRYGNHSVNSGFIWTTTKPITPTFVNPSAMVFSGSEYVDLGIDPIHRPADQFSIAGWFYIDSYPSDYANLFGNLYDSGPVESGYALGVRTTGGLYFAVQTGTGFNYGLVTTINTGQWYHVVATYDSAVGRKVYLNGAMVFNNNVPLGSVDYNPINSTHIGAYKDNDELHLIDGMLDDFRLYDHVLSGAEISALLNGDRMLDVSPVTNVNLNVLPINDIPVPYSDLYVVDEDGVLNEGVGVLINDVDVDGDTLTAVEVSPPTNGGLVLNSDGTFTYTPDPDFSGTDYFSYAAEDAEYSVTEYVTITVTAYNDAPIAMQDNYVTNEDTVKVVAPTGVLMNDIDVDGDPLTVVLQSQPANGVVSLSPDGGFVYTPTLNYYGLDSFTYLVHDTPNDLLAYWPLDEGATNKTQDWSSYGNDGNLMNGPTWVSTVPVTPTFNNPYALDFDGSQYVEMPTDLAHQPDGAFSVATWFYARSFNNYAHIVGNIYDFGVDQSGFALGTFSPGQIYFSIVTTSTGNLAYDAMLTGLQTNRWYHVVATYHPDIGRTVYLDGVFANSKPSPKDGVEYDPANSLKIGAYRDPGLNSFFNGMIDDVRIYDRVLTAAEAAALANGDYLITVSNIDQARINVVSQNDAPITVGETYATGEDIDLTVLAASGLLQNDYDVEGSGLTASLVTPPGNGLVAINSDGSFTYRPNLDFYGVDHFSYGAKDGELTTPQVVTVVVSAINDTPVALGDVYETAVDTPITVAPSGILGNDYDVDGDLMSSVLLSTPANGSVLLLSDGGFTYTPSLSFTGIDTFTYGTNDIPPDWLAYWPLDNRTNNNIANEWSAAARHGVLEDVTSWSSNVPPAVSFDDPYSLDVAGAFGKVSLGIHPEHQPPAAFAISTWIYLRSYNNYAQIFGNIYDSGGLKSGYGLGVRPGGLYFGVKSTGVANIDYIKRVNVPLNEWHHVVAMYAPGTGREIYLDGVLVFGPNAQGGVMDYDPANGAHIGAYIDGGFAYYNNGLIDDLRLYDRLLTPAEIASLSAGNRELSISNNQEVKIVVPASSGCVTPDSVTNLNVVQSSDDATLSWSATAQTSWYEVWSSGTDATFTPGASCGNPGADVCDLVTNPGYLDLNATLTGGTSRYYTVVSADSCGVQGTASNRVGAFNFVISPGQ